MQQWLLQKVKEKPYWKKLSNTLEMKDQIKRVKATFFSADSISLKVCGVTGEEDASRLVKMGVPALGVNFWEKSKRYCAPENADFLKKVGGLILRVGVFVNAEKAFVERLYKENFIDVVQLHGDEDSDYCAYFAARDIPYIRAIGVKNEASFSMLKLPKCAAILLDAHAPTVYGGTGEVFDWSMIPKVKTQFPELPIILAGGITAKNVEKARQLKDIVALDVASGAEISPGEKDFEKVKLLME